MPSAFGFAFELLHDQVVVLARFDVAAILANGLAGCRLGVPSSSVSISGNVAQPRSITSSTKASRVPEVGGGPSTSIFSAGSAGLMSLHVL